MTPTLHRLALPLLCALGLSAAFATEAAARTKPEQRRSLVWLLSSYELKLGQDNLGRVGPDVGELLVDILNTPNEAVRVRIRAVAALAFYPSEATFDVLRALLHERAWKGTELGLQLRRQALRSLGRGFGDRAIDEMLGLRTDPEPLIREALALGLLDAGSVRALPILETWLPAEPHLAVRAAVDRAVSRLQTLR
jgi:HEAT repeat protein